MTNAETQIQWESAAEKKYKHMIAKIPLFHRDIARQVVDKKAVINAQERGSQLIEESDIIRAFYSEVPMIFYSLMIRLFEDCGFDYKKYEKK